jgi:formylglycine-generating enzyme required for sulfatase activity
MVVAQLLAAVAYGQVLPTEPAKPKPVITHTQPAANQSTPKQAAPKLDDSLVLVHGGGFSMGSDDAHSFVAEKPVHTVTAGSFYISKYELTVAEFKKFVDETPYTTTADQEGKCYVWTGGAFSEEKAAVNWRCGSDGAKLLDFEMNKPVVHISYNVAVKYCKWKSYKTGKTWRLPTEAEWKYAARGGNRSNGYIYNGSNNIDDVAWYNGNSGMKMHPVRQQQPNELGLYDMSGNVWEWCSDWWDMFYYGSSPSQNPQGASTGSNLAIRGGAWYDEHRICLVTSRNGRVPGHHDGSIGFRPVESF